jgi:hypothetical protein
MSSLPGHHRTCWQSSGLTLINCIVWSRPANAGRNNYHWGWGVYFSTAHAKRESSTYHKYQNSTTRQRSMKNYCRPSARAADAPRSYLYYTRSQACKPHKTIYYLSFPYGLWATRHDLT